MRNRGIALVATLAIVAIIGVLVFGSSFTTLVEQWTTRNDSGALQAEYVAKAGIQKYKTLAFQAFRYYLKNPSQYSDEAAVYATCGNLLQIGLDMNRDGDVSDSGDILPGGTVTETVAMANGTTGTYTVRFDVDGQYLVLRSVGKYAGAKATIQAVAVVDNEGLFSNALVAGGGVASRINGNAEVWGSVYVQGSPSAPNALVIDSNGSFNMHNYYTKNDLKNITYNRFTDAQLKDFLKLQALEQKDMCGTLRVNSGRVSLGGNATLGDPSLQSGVSASDGWNNKLKGVYVDAGVQGCNTTDDVCVSGSASINSDNGVGAYNLSEPIKVPQLRTGNSCDDGRQWADCLNDMAANNGITLKKGQTPPSYCSSLSSSIASNGTITFGNTPITCLTTNSSGQPVGFRYFQDGSTSQWRLEVNGMANFEGYDLSFANSVLVRYNGKASLFVESSNNQGGNVTFDGDVLPGNSFPDQDVLGVIADKTIRFTGDNVSNSVSSASEQIAVGLFYAQDTISIEQGGVVLGTAISDQICTSSNCNAGQTAKIVQVPGLEYNLAPGFEKVKNATVATFGQLTYERR